MKKEKEKKEKSKLRTWIENIIEIIVIVACISISIILISNPGGMNKDYTKISVNYMPVLSDSMSGTFEKGDLIFGKKIKRDENGNCEILDIGDVAIFVVNNPSISEYQYINTHRIAAYYYEYRDDKGDYFAGYSEMYGNEAITTAESAYAFAEEKGWNKFQIIGYKTTGDNKSIYYKDGDVNGELINPNNTKLLDDSYVYVNNIIGTWEGKKISHVGGVLSWIKEPTHFFFVIIIPLILLFGYNIFVVVKYLIEVNADKARKLALEEAKGKSISIEEEEEIKRKAIEEYMKKMGINPNSSEEETKE